MPDLDYEDMIKLAEWKPVDMELRARALYQAVEAFKGTTPTMIIGAAKDFYAWLKSGDTDNG